MKRSPSWNPSFFHKTGKNPRDVFFLGKPNGLPLCLGENTSPNEDAKEVGGGSNGSYENDLYLGNVYRPIYVYQVSSPRCHFCRAAAKIVAIRVFWGEEENLRKNFISRIRIWFSAKCVLLFPGLIWVFFPEHAVCP